MPADEIGDERRRGLPCVPSNHHGPAIGRSGRRRAATRNLNNKDFGISVTNERDESLTIDVHSAVRHDGRQSLGRGGGGGSGGILAFEQQCVGKALQQGSTDHQPVLGDIVDHEEARIRHRGVGRTLGDADESLWSGGFRRGPRFEDRGRRLLPKIMAAPVAIPSRADRSRDACEQDEEQDRAPFLADRILVLIGIIQ